jgi:hypothetical protein
MTKDSDPAKNPEFQRVLKKLLSTPPKPQSEMKVGKGKRKSNVAAKRPKSRQEGRG